LPTFSPDTRVYSRPAGAIDPSSAYAQAMRQYATTSVRDPAAMQPAHIIYPATAEDIVAAVRYARSAGISIAVRSGGHAYHGGSSTGGDNIQIDTTRCRDCKVWTFDAQARQVTIGTGWKLGEVEENLQNNYGGYETRGSFFAHGNCAGVGVGGQLHTGGYSMQTRSFGLFVDYVVTFRIILADGAMRDVHKPDPAAPDEVNDGLWFAVLGGGPGSFGVCTQVTMRLLHEREFPASRAYMQTYVWTRKRGSQLVEALLQHMATVSDRDDLPADFCLHVSLASAAPKYFRWQNIVRDAGATAVGVAEQVLQRQAKRPTPLARPAAALLWLVRALFGTRGGRNPLLEASFFPLIIVQASWNNLSGEAADYNDEVRSFFAGLDAVAEPFLPRGVLGRLVRRALRIVDPRKPLPISQIIQAFTFKGERELDLPYMKRNWFGYETQLAPRGFAREAAQLFAPFTHSLWSPKSETWDGTAVVCAWGYLGGSASNMTRFAARTGTAMPHRGSRIAWMTDYFYDPAVEGAADRLRAWIARYDKRVVGHEAAFFSTRDARSMFDPFDVAGPDGQTAPLSVDRLRAHFYDDDAVYQRVLATKRLVDPAGVFSAHPFCVGAGAAAAEVSAAPEQDPPEIRVAS
jgi:FAD/FMN-containing dehydrogenase